MSEKEAICKEFGLTDDQYVEYKAAFDMFDIDKSGDISADELVSVLGQLGKETSLDDAKDMIRLVDENGDGDIDFREFVIMMKGNEGGKDDELRTVFDIFDADGNGYIDKDELKNVMTQLMGHNVTDSELESMMKEADLDNDGQIDFEEFKKMMS